MENFTQYTLKTGGVVKELMIPKENMCIFDSLIFIDSENNPFISVKKHNGITYHSELGHYEHILGPLVFSTRKVENEKNQFYSLNEDLSINNIIDDDYNYKLKECQIIKTVENIQYVDNAKPEETLDGGSQVIFYDGGYLSLCNITINFTDECGRNDKKCEHQFIHWDLNWNIIRKSKTFNFMGGNLEYSSGISKYKNDYLISFSFQNNASFILKISSNSLENFINV